MSNYNLVIESTNAAPSEIAQEILNKLEAFEKGKFTKMMELNPSSIYPCKQTIAKGDLTVQELNGTWFVVEGSDMLKKAVKEGRKFVSVKVDSSVCPELISEDEVMDFEQEIGIEYIKYPTTELLQEKGFMDFSRL